MNGDDSTSKKAVSGNPPLRLFAFFCGNHRFSCEQRSQKRPPFPVLAFDPKSVGALRDPRLLSLSLPETLRGDCEAVTESSRRCAATAVLACVRHDAEFVAAVVLGYNRPTFVSRQDGGSH